MAALNVELETKNNVLIVHMDGELDHHSVDYVRQQIEDAINGDVFIKHLLIDVKNLVFMDSSGVGMLIGRYKTISARGGKVAVIGIAPQTKRIFEISGLFNIFSVYENQREAIKNLTQQKGSL
jgi:stage II sporulation protein AA (anti-sigma F factor antagonist)